LRPPHPRFLVMAAASASVLQCLRRGHLLGDHMPEYLLYVAYTLLVVGVAACLAFIARNFEDEDPAPHSKQPVQSHNPRGR
jgi:hypothetical protein